MPKVKIEKLGVILRPTQRLFETKAVLNPGIYQAGHHIHMLYRAIGKDFISTIGYARLDGPTNVIDRSPKPVITPSYKYEVKGVEDPRITKINNTYYIPYVAHDGKNALTGLITSKDLKKFKKHGLISPRITYDTAAELFREEKLKDEYFMFEAFYEEFSAKDMLLWEKDVFFFPEKIDGKFAVMHRILPDIQIIYPETIADLKKKSFWEDYLKNLADYVVLENKYWFESRNIGGGAPPVKTKDGWLLIFHSVEQSNKNKAYHASAALLHKDNPRRVIGRLDYPLFSPTKEWEKYGFVENVVFPTGTATIGNDLYIYYGAADTYIAVARVSLPELLKELKNSKSN